MQEIQQTLVPVALTVSKSQTFEGNSYLHSAQNRALLHLLLSRADSVEADRSVNLPDLQNLDVIDVEMEDI